MISFNDVARSVTISYDWFRYCLDINRLELKAWANDGPQKKLLIQMVSLGHYVSNPIAFQEMETYVKFYEEKNENTILYYEIAQPRNIAD